MFHTEVQLQSCGTMLKRFLILRLEIGMFMNEKGKIVAEPCVVLGFGNAV